MPVLSTLFGRIVAHENPQYAEDGTLCSCIAADASPLETAYGTLVPQYTSNLLRKRQLPGISFYPNASYEWFILFRSHRQNSAILNQRFHILLLLIYKTSLDSIIPFTSNDKFSGGLLPVHWNDWLAAFDHIPHRLQWDTAFHECLDNFLTHTFSRTYDQTGRR